MEAIPTHKELTQKLAESIKPHHYEVKLDARLGLLSSYRPDIIIKKGDKTIVLEVKTSAIPINAIREAIGLPVQKVIICAPSHVIATTSANVANYAAMSGVGLCNIDQTNDIEKLIEEA